MSDVLPYQVHPICRELPDMSEREYEELRESIRERGLIQPIELFEGKVLDGRHRLKICTELGLRPKTVEFQGGDPWLRVWDRNGARREWSGGAAQKYAVWLVLQAGSTKWIAEQERLRQRANEKRSAKTKQRARKPDGTLASAPTDSGRTGSAGSTNAGAKSRASAAGVDRGTVEKVDAVVAANPEFLEQLASGEVKLAEAQRKAKRDRVAAKAGALPAGKFRVIYADPPWQYNDQRKTDGGFGVTTMRESTAAENHYPTMSANELAALDVKSLSADDCVLFCWATFPLLPQALELFGAWGFKYKTAFVWDKGRGYVAPRSLPFIAEKQVPDRMLAEFDWPRGSDRERGIWGEEIVYWMLLVAEIRPPIWAVRRLETRREQYDIGDFELTFVTRPVFEVKTEGAEYSESPNLFVQTEEEGHKATLVRVGGKIVSKQTALPGFKDER